MSENVSIEELHKAVKLAYERGRLDAALQIQTQAVMDAEKAMKISYCVLEQLREELDKYE